MAIRQIRVLGDDVLRKKCKEVKEMTSAELTAKLAELKSELFNLRFRLASGQLENPVSIRTCKRDIARVNTEIRARELKA